MTIIVVYSVGMSIKDKESGKPATPRTFGEFLRAFRQAQGIGLVELAHRAGIDPGLLSRIETGKRKPPQTMFLNRLLKPLGIEEDSDEHKALYRLAGRTLWTTEELLERVSANRPVTYAELENMFLTPELWAVPVIAADLAELISKASEEAIRHGATSVTLGFADGSRKRFQVVAKTEGNEE